MSEEPMVPQEPTAPLTGEGVAERYVAKELEESRESLKRTQIIGSILTVGLVAYVVYLTNGFRASLEPSAAAEITTGLASQRLDDLAPKFSSYVREEVPKAIRRAPDEVIARLPQYREDLEKRVENSLRLRSNEATTRLNSELMTYLEGHKDQVGELLKNADDPATMTALGQGMEDQFRTFLKSQPVGGETIQVKLDKTLNALTLVERRTARLAANKGLTPSEQKARHAVAMLMHRIDSAEATSGAIELPQVDVAKARQAVTDATTRVRAALPKGE